MPAFEKETGIKVNYDVFDSNEVLETKLLAGNTGYDVVVPSASFLAAPDQGRRVPEARQVEAAEPRRTWIPTSRARVALHDPGNAVRRELHVGHRPASATTRRRSRRDAERAGRQLGACSSIRPSSRTSRTAASRCSTRPTRWSARCSLYLGKDPNSESPEDLQAAEKVLLTIRPYIRNINSSQYIEELANGEICLALGWSGDVLQARDRASEAGKGVKIKYIDPEGRRDHVVRHAGDPGRRAAPEECATCSSTTCCGPRWRRRTRTSCTTRTASRGLRRWSTRPCATIPASIRRRGAEGASVPDLPRTACALHARAQPHLDTLQDRAADAERHGGSVQTMPDRTRRTADDPAAKPYVQLEKVTKKFGDFIAVDDVSLTSTKGRSSACSAPPAAARRRCCACWPASSARAPARSVIDGAGHDRRCRRTSGRST